MTFVVDCLCLTLSWPVQRFRPYSPSWDLYLIRYILLGALCRSGVSHSPTSLGGGFGSGATLLPGPLDGSTGQLMGLMALALGEDSRGELNKVGEGTRGGMHIVGLGRSLGIGLKSEDRRRRFV